MHAADPECTLLSHGAVGTRGGNDIGRYRSRLFAALRGSRARILGLDAVHFPRPVTRYWSETHPDSFNRGTSHFARFYGMMIDGLETSYINGFAYNMMKPAPEEEIPQRFQRAEEVFADKLWREQLREWDEERQARIDRRSPFDPGSRSGRPLGRGDGRVPRRRCRDHHAAMIFQHMRFTGSAVVTVGDFLAHVGDWTELPPSELLGLTRGSAPVSAGASAELERLVRAMELTPPREAAPVRRRGPRADPRFAALTGRGGRRGDFGLPRPGRLPAARRLRHLRALRSGDAGCPASCSADRDGRTEGRDLRARGADRRRASQCARAAPRRVRRAARRGSGDVPAARRARRLQRHLGFRPDEARGPECRTQTGGQRPHPPPGPHRRRHARGDVRPGGRLGRAVGRRAGDTR